MVALSRCLSYVAALLASAAGARVARGLGQDTKIIAGVPVLNYKPPRGQLGAEEEWLVMVKPHATDAHIEQMCHAAKNGCKLKGSPSKGGVPFFDMRGTESDLEVVLSSAPGLVQYVEPDQMSYDIIPEMSADTQEVNYWGLERIGAYQRTSTGKGVTVFVLDSGVHHRHNDFGGRAIAGADFTNEGGPPPKICKGEYHCAFDSNGHGTHVAGSAVGKTFGVAPEATAIAVKVLRGDGMGLQSGVLAGMDWVSQSSQRPAVATMSLGSKGTSEVYKTAIDSLTAAGLTLTVAAGNSDDDSCDYTPAREPKAITVGATESSDIKAWFSNYGRCIDIWAPGRHIWSASHQDPDGSTRMSGTSMACPYVAGAAALVLERNPSFNFEKVRSSIRASALSGAIGGLKPEDTNKMLFIGGAGPSPMPPPTPTASPPTPTPPTPTTPTTSPPTPTPMPPTPPPTGECMHQKDCDVSPWCTDTGFEVWCRNQGQNGSCPAPYCTRV